MLNILIAIAIGWSLHLFISFCNEYKNDDPNYLNTGNDDE